MRTTINIHDGLLETVKQRAKERGQTVGEVFEDAAQAYLAQPAPDPLEAPELPVFRSGGGLRQGIDPTSNASMFEAAGDENEDFARRRRDAAS